MDMCGRSQKHNGQTCGAGPFCGEPVPAFSGKPVPTNDAASWRDEAPAASVARQKRCSRVAARYRRCAARSAACCCRNSVGDCNTMKHSVNHLNLKWGYATSRPAARSRRCTPQFVVCCCGSSVGDFAQNPAFLEDDHFVHMLSILQAQLAQLA